MSQLGWTSRIRIFFHPGSVHGSRGQKSTGSGSATLAGSSLSSVFLLYAPLRRFLGGKRPDLDDLDDEDSDDGDLPELE
jgi:hypothetical protein